MSDARRGKRPVPALPAASVLLVRDGAPGLEVLLQERHPNTRFAGGATVFPGGKVDAGDADAGALNRARGLDGLDAAARALRLAAVRELFEECGILLARAAGEGGLLEAPRTAVLAAAYRDGLEEGVLGIGELALREDLELATEELVPFAHWITPEPLPRRFDTHFFLAPLPPGQTVRDEASESVRLRWATPQAALADADAGRCTMMFPTRMNLGKLGRSGDVAGALEAARRAPVVTVLPCIDTGGARGPMLRIPAEAGYDVVELPLDDVDRG